jgi:hypothetical protein
MRRLVAVVVLAACHHGPAQPPAPAAPTPPAQAPAGPTPAARARPFVEAQLAALIADDRAALTASFDPAALVMRPRPLALDDAIANLRPDAFALDPHDELLEAKLTRLDAGGTARAVWIEFDVAVHKKAWEAGGGADEYVVHGSELIAASAGWHAVAAAFSADRAPRPGSSFGPLAGATAAGPLTEKLRAELAKQSIEIEAVREAHGDGWGVVQALVDTPRAKGLPLRAAAMVIAVPDDHVVGIHSYGL